LSSKSVSGKFTACDWAVPQAAATAVNLYGIVYEVAALVSFVTGPDSSYITGTNLTVDGGHERLITGSRVSLTKSFVVHHPTR
jgi:NAD(P)-dependent dehydrogenase (short-subunit alcohol dehydrogenase family)